MPEVIEMVEKVQKVSIESEQIVEDAEIEEELARFEKEESVEHPINVELEIQKEELHQRERESLNQEVIPTEMSRVLYNTDDSKQTDTFVSDLDDMKLQETISHNEEVSHITIIEESVPKKHRESPLAAANPGFFQKKDKLPGLFIKYDEEGRIISSGTPRSLTTSKSLELMRGISLED